MRTVIEGTIGAVELWRAKLEQPFSDMTMCKELFGVPGFNLVTGCEDGMARVYQFTKEGMDTQPKLELETKSGPIQCVAVDDISRFGSDELIVGDSNGVITVFSRKHILARSSLSEKNDSVTCMAVIKDNDNIPVIVCSNESAIVSGVRPNKVLWRLDLNNCTIPGIEKDVASYPVSILCLAGVHITDICGNRRFYLLVADNARRVHVMSKGHLVKSIPVPINITTVLMEFPTNSWVISIDTADIDDDGTEEVIISCKDKSVIALRTHCTENITTVPQ